MSLKLLLLQARQKNDPVRLEERHAFADHAGVALEQIVPCDLLESTPALAEIRRYDALMIGGSGAFSVSMGNLPNQNGIMAVLADVVETGHPTFASCFGFHLMVQALGGQVIYDPDCMEVGTYELTRSENGRADELFGRLPDTFLAQLGHKDRAARLPDGVINLAASASAPYQAIRFPGKPIWATQFHPELTGEANLQRFHRYQNEYAAVYGPDEVEAALKRFQESPETDGLIRHFLDIIFGADAGKGD